MIWNPVAALDALLDQQPHEVTAGRITLVLVRQGDAVAAIAAQCSHAAVALTGGSVCDGEIECPAHGARFDLTTGEARCLPATKPIAVYPTKIEGGQVYVALPD